MFWFLTPRTLGICWKKRTLTSRTTNCLWEILGPSLPTCHPYQPLKPSSATETCSHHPNHSSRQQLLALGILEVWCPLHLYPSTCHPLEWALCHKGPQASLQHHHPKAAAQFNRVLAAMHRIGALKSSLNR